MPRSDHDPVKARALEDVRIAVAAARQRMSAKCYGTREFVSWLVYWEMNTSKAWPFRFIPNEKCPCGKH